MTMVFDRSHKEIIGGPVIIEDDEPATKYRAESDGRTFWAYNGMEVFYEDERLYGALDRIEALEAQNANYKEQIVNLVREKHNKIRRSEK